MEKTATYIVIQYISTGVDPDAWMKTLDYAYNGEPFCVLTVGGTTTNGGGSLDVNYAEGPAAIFNNAPGG